jgi:hypothetical protein
MASLRSIAVQQKKNAKLILHLILELASNFGLNIDKNLFKKITFSKAVKILQYILQKIRHTTIHLSQLKHNANKEIS